MGRRAKVVYLLASLVINAGLTSAWWNAAHMVSSPFLYTITRAISAHQQHAGLGPNLSDGAFNRLRMLVSAAQITTIQDKPPRRMGSDS